MVQQLLGLLDELVLDLRLAVATHGSISLASSQHAAASIRAAPAGPGVRESIEQAFTVAGVTPEPPERALLFQAIPEDPRGCNWTTSRGSRIRARAVAELSDEQRTDERYRDLASRSLDVAAKRVRKAEIRAIESVIPGRPQDGRLTGPPWLHRAPSLLPRWPPE